MSNSNKINLLNTIKNGDLETIKYLDYIGFDFNFDNHKALSYSIIEKQFDIAKFLITKCTCQKLKKNFEEMLKIEKK